MKIKHNLFTRRNKQNVNYQIFSLVPHQIIQICIIYSKHNTSNQKYICKICETKKNTSHFPVHSHFSVSRRLAESLMNTAKFSISAFSVINYRRRIKIRLFYIPFRSLQPLVNGNKQIYHWKLHFIRIESYTFVMVVSFEKLHRQRENTARYTKFNWNKFSPRGNTAQCWQLAILKFSSYKKNFLIDE